MKPTMSIHSFISHAVLLLLPEAPIFYLRPPFTSLTPIILFYSIFYFFFLVFCARHPFVTTHPFLRRQYLLSNLVIFYFLFFRCQAPRKCPV